MMDFVWLEKDGISPEFSNIQLRKLFIWLSTGTAQKELHIGKELQGKEKPNQIFSLYIEQEFQPHNSPYFLEMS